MGDSGVEGLEPLSRSILVMMVIGWGSGLFAGDSVHFWRSWPREVQALRWLVALSLICMGIGWVSQRLAQSAAAADDLDLDFQSLRRATCTRAEDAKLLLAALSSDAGVEQSVDEKIRALRRAGCYNVEVHEDLACGLDPRRGRDLEPFKLLSACFLTGHIFLTLELGAAAERAEAIESLEGALVLDAKSIKNLSACVLLPLALVAAASLCRTMARRRAVRAVELLFWSSSSLTLLVDILVATKGPAAAGRIATAWLVGTSLLVLLECLRAPTAPCCGPQTLEGSCLRSCYRSECCGANEAEPS